MPTGLLGQQDKEAEDQDRQDQRGQRPAERQSAVVVRLVQKVADDSAQGARENKGDPEQHHPVNPGP